MCVFVAWTKTYPHWMCVITRTDSFWPGECLDMRPVIMQCYKKFSVLWTQWNERLIIAWAVTCPPCSCFGGLDTEAAGISEEVSAVWVWIKNNGHWWLATWWLSAQSWPLLSIVWQNATVKDSEQGKNQTSRSVEQRKREGKQMSNSLILNYF